MALPAESRSPQKAKRQDAAVQTEKEGAIGAAVKDSHRHRSTVLRPNGGATCTARRGLGEFHQSPGADGGRY
eukprot:2266080-Prymnesium_polylepis.2